MDDPVTAPLSSELLGFPPGARVLVVNCDDLGMYDAVNAGIIDAVTNGIATSCSLMVPCPAAADALRLLRRHPEIPFGIHLTLIRDTPGLPWGPLSPREKVPSLLDANGELFCQSGIPELLARARPDDIAREFRAQIEAVSGAGRAPTHLDWHCLADGGREDILDLTMALAAEYGLAVRVWLDPGRAAARRRGLPVVDNDFLDSFSLGADGRQARCAALLRALPAGLSEWAMHPALGAEEARAADGGRRVRSGDHAFLTSPEARDILRQEGIILTDHRAARRIWSARNTAPWHRENTTGQPRHGRHPRGEMLDSS
ncbi:carbohydrate deacetylase [Streptomyces sp. GC420]|uniref:carbohydrate deacetylase n=1 Tax=Streptomyces sp. GC420 TaxID=2697568 RepID=UPI0014152238|nr:polysaccharide deacetylase family protein [Streptomyces sp. GC420]NBM20372.1 ChbG/HpnK family deacetylase [Streptomyces sp. GC420]